MKGLVVVFGALGALSFFVLGFAAIGQEVSASPGFHVPSFRSAISEAPGNLWQMLSHDSIRGFILGVALLAAFYLVYRNHAEQE